MELVILTQSQALDLLKEAYLQGRRESGDDSAMNVEQAAAFLGIGEGTLYTRALNGEIPCKRGSGKSTYFCAGMLPERLRTANRPF